MSETREKMESSGSTRAATKPGAALWDGASSTPASPAAGRLDGLDIARGLAIVGMTLRHALGRFSPDVFDEQGAMAAVASFVDCFPAAIFMVLAGIGVGLFTRSLTRAGRPVQPVLWRRAAVLLAAGVVFMMVWPHEVLRIYGLFFLLVPWLVRAPGWMLALIAAAVVVLEHSLLVLTLPPEQDWSETFIAASGLDSWSGFFYLGARPFLPWVVLPLVGLWLSRFDLRTAKVQRRLFALGLAAVLVGQFGAMALGALIPEDNDILVAFMSAADDPATVLFLCTITGVALMVIAAVVALGIRVGQWVPMQALASTGRLAFTWYVAHLCLIQLLYTAGLRGESEQAFAMALMMIATMITASILIERSRRRGPLETLLRRFSA